MKIDKAIEILEEYTRRENYAPYGNDRKAIKLGIEALRCLEGLHNLPYGSPLPPLAGETPEEETERR